MEDKKKDQKEYYIIYFDILGYKQYFEENDNHQKLLHDIIKMLQEVQLMAKIYQNIIKNDTKIKAFSDNIIICVEATERTRDNLDFLGFVVANTQAQIFAKYGLLIRGAYSKGKLYVDRNIVYGEGLIRAVALENEAKYPRIVVDSKAIQLPVLEYEGYKVFSQDVDGRLFINYFDKTHIQGIIKTFRDKLVKKIVKDGKYNPRVEDENKIKVYESIIQKTLWVVEKFNDACDAIGKPEEKIDYRVTINKRLLKMELSLAEKA